MGVSRVPGVIVVSLITVMSVAYPGVSWAQFKLPPSAGALLGESRYAQPLELLPRTGTRYQTLRPTWIHEKPDAASRILYDVDRLRIVYAEPTSDPQWLQAKAIGDERMPSYYQLDRPGPSADDRQTIVNSRDGRLQLIPPNDFDDVVSTYGFVRVNDLLNAEPRADAGDAMGHMQNLQPLPSLWSKIGAMDNRSFLLNLDTSPGNAIVLILAKGLCSGAIVGRPDIVLTAAHCVIRNDGKTSDAMVKIWRGPGRIEKIKATLLAKGDYVKRKSHDDHEAEGEDWALLQLARAPSVKVEPLEFFVDGDSLHAARLQLLTVGYPADSLVPAVHQYQFLPPTVSPCEVFASNFRIRQKNKSTATVATLDARCIGNHGDSGGPILVWNAKRKRFEIIAIDNSGVAANFTDGHIYRFSLSAELASLVDRNKKEIVDRYKSVYGIDGPIPVAVADALSELGESAVAVSAVLGKGLDIPGRRDYQSTETDIFTKGHAVPGIASLRSAIVTSYGHIREDAGISLNHKILETLQRMTGTSMDMPIGLGSDLIEDDRRQPRWFAFDDPDQRHVTEPMYISSILDRSVREWCANQCEAEWLSPHKQLRVRLGDSIDLNKLVDTKTASITGIKTKENWVKIPIVSDPKSDVKLLTTGGDLFIVAKDGTIELVVRRFMNLTDDGKDLVAGFRWVSSAGRMTTAELQQKSSANSDRSNIAPTSTLRTGNYGAETPASIAGGKTIDAYGLYIMMAGATPPIVVAAMGAPYGLPTAHMLPSSGIGGSFGDKIQSDLEKSLGLLTKGDKARDIVFYCHHFECWLSHNAAVRAIALGYKSVYWMRGGLSEWIQRSFPLQRMVAEN